MERQELELMIRQREEELSLIQTRSHSLQQKLSETSAKQQADQAHMTALHTRLRALGARLKRLIRTERQDDELNVSTTLTKTVSAESKEINATHDEYGTALEGLVCMVEGELSMLYGETNCLKKVLMCVCVKLCACVYVCVCVCARTLRLNVTERAREDIQRGYVCDMQGVCFVLSCVPLIYCSTLPVSLVQRGLHKTGAVHPLMTLGCYDYIPYLPCVSVCVYLPRDSILS